MTDAELQAKYPFPPDVQELAETMLNGGKPVARSAAQGVAQMTAILQKLREDKAKLINTLEDNLGDRAFSATLRQDLKELNREIADYEQRLAEYTAQQQGIN